MLINSEKKLLNFVKYSPVIVITIVAIIVNFLIYHQNETNYKHDLEIYKTNFLETNKALVKAQVEKVYNDITNEKSKLESELKTDLKNKVYEAYQIVENIHKKFSKDGEEKVLELIKVALQNIRFNEGRGYYYIHNTKGINILHPINTALENTSVLKVKDVNGLLIVKDLIEKLKNKDEYYNQYYWNKPDNVVSEYKKISFNKIYKPLNLIIGTGEYLDVFADSLKEHMIYDHIQKVSYGNNGYVFVFDYDGVQLAHIKKSYIGQNRIDLTDANGFKVTQEIINKAKEGEGYIKYIGTIMPETGKPAIKTTYVKGLDEWNWAIASGFYDKEMIQYLDRKSKELKETNNQSLKKTLMISIILSIFLLFIALYISKILKTFFNNYNQRIEREILANRKKDVILHQQSKMASMGEMIANIAHQWRQPLNLISTATSRIKFENEFGTLTKEGHIESLDAILKSTKHLSKTIDDFREFFNPNKVLHEVSTEAFYEKTIQLISARFKDKDIQLESNIIDFNIMTYENELIQAIINILNNSIDALSNKEIENKVVFVNIEHTMECTMPDCEDTDCKQKNEGCLIITIKEKIIL